MKCYYVGSNIILNHPVYKYAHTILLSKYSIRIIAFQCNTSKSKMAGIYNKCKDLAKMVTDIFVDHSVLIIFV